MRSYKTRKKNNLILGALAVVLITMAVGYSIFSSNLNITGTSNISNNWDIRISKVEGTLGGHAAHAKDTNENEINPECDSDTNNPKSCGEGLTVTFSDLFYYEGDSSTYTITLKNSGSLDASLTQNVEPVITSNSDKIKVELEGFKTKGQILAKGDSQTTTLTITYLSETALAESNNKIKPLSNTKTITPRLLDNEEQQSEVSITITYPFVQDVESGGVSPERHQVEYDCTTNGGTSCTNFKEYVKTGESVNLENTSSENKYGLPFLGWNTDKDAEEGLSTLTMGNNDIKLYAIYKKDKITFNSVTTTSTTNSITVVASASALSEITKYEYSTDGENYYEGSIDTENNNSIYTFTGLNQSTTYPIYVKATAKSGISDIYEYQATLLDNVDTVTEGDGLYEDSTEDGRYIYRGGEPDNYICLGDLSNGTCPENSLYRIISIESDGTLKVIKNISIGTMSWDPYYANELTYNGITITSANTNTGTRRQGTSNSSYFCRDKYTTENSSYFGCKSWGSASSTLNSNGSTTSTMPLEVGGIAYTLPTYNSWLNVYLNGGTYHAEASTTSVTGWIDGSSNGLNSTAKSKVLSTKAFNIGPVSSDTSYTLINNRTQEAAYKWKGKVGLMNVTDYVAASTNSACTNLYNYYNFVNGNCYINSKTHNWLFVGLSEWTISPFSEVYSDIVYNIFSPGSIGSGGSSNSNAVRPVLYLSSDINLSGIGTSDKPYIIGNGSSTRKLQTPTFKEKSEATSNKTTVTIDYHKECGNNGVTCTYIKDGETIDNLTGSIQTVDFTANGTLVATISDGINTTTTSSYTVTMPTKIGNNYYQLKTSGDGLYADSTESNRYIYKGANPNNYICLGNLASGICPENSKYRIIAIESDGALKVIKNASIGDLVWDPGYSTELIYNSSITITASKNVSGTRRQGISTSSYFCRDYDTTANNSYYGCKSWGSKTTTLNSSGSTTSTMSYEVNGTAYTLPTYNSWINTYLNGGTYHKETNTTSITGWYDGSSTGLNSTAKSKVLSTKTFNIGPVISSDSYTLANNRTQEATYKWKGKVGLMNITDYVAASTKSACTSLYTYRTGSCYFDSRSQKHNWLFTGAREWTISSASHASARYVYFVSNDGSAISIDVVNPYAVRPVMFLSADTKLNGEGTNDSGVYTIAS